MSRTKFQQCDFVTIVTGVHTGKRGIVLKPRTTQYSGNLVYIDGERMPLPYEDSENSVPPSCDYNINYLKLDVKFF